MIIAGNDFELEYSIIVDEDVQVTGTGCIIRNCILYNGTYNIDESCEIYNSIGFNPGGDDINVAAGKNVNGKNNCFHDAAKSGTGTYTDIGSLATLWNTDPKFTNVGIEDFGLLFDSPCKNVGDNSVWSGVADVFDYDGNVITDSGGNIIAFGGIVDIGAIECQLTLPPTPPIYQPIFRSRKAIDQFDGDVAFILTPDGGQIIYQGGQPIMDAGGLENAVNISLFTGLGYWANALNENEPDKQIGSDFEERIRPKTITMAYLRDVEDAARDALQWMINQKIAQTIEARAIWPELNQVDLELLITKPEGDIIKIRYELSWEGGVLFPVTAKVEGA